MTSCPRGAPTLPRLVAVGLSQSLQAHLWRQLPRMHVRDGMSTMVLTVGPGHTLRQAACHMAERGVGAAVVVDPEAAGPGIITERDLLEAIGAGQDPDTET